MAFNRGAGGHAFNLNGQCIRCGIPLEKFDDGGEPECRGHDRDEKKLERAAPIANGGYGLRTAH